MIERVYKLFKSKEKIAEERSIMCVGFFTQTDKFTFTSFSNKYEAQRIINELHQSRMTVVGIMDLNEAINLSERYIEKLNTEMNIY